jgi:hypothetical protein
MNCFANALMSCVAVAWVLSGSALAATTTDYSDQWWNENESGWGASLLQQKDVIFADLFVYDANRKPTWFTTTMYRQTGPGDRFVGDLYTTSGPSFAGAFDPAGVTRRVVGTATFTPNSTSSATLDYSVDGVAVTRNVTRQTWALNSLSGRYLVAMYHSRTPCPAGASLPELKELGEMTIAQSGSAYSAQSVTDHSTCTYSGNYAQTGRLGTSSGTVSCTNGARGTYTTSEMEAGPAGIVMRMSSNLVTVCLSSNISGARIP